MGKQAVRLTLFVGPQKKKYFEELFDIEYLTFSQMIRQLIREYIEEKMGRSWWDEVFTDENDDEKNTSHKRRKKIRNAVSLSSKFTRVSLKWVIPFTLTMASFSLSSLVYASSSSETAAKNIIVESCKACHGLDGKARMGNGPNLNCQNWGYLYKRLHAFTGSDNDHAIDDRVVRELSFEEIDFIAHYYSETACSKSQH